ncbi:hypothetical protein HDV00_000717 [Rhizophlyctis rosea]|nr:hypothetical protein HDV00_000717 [Rhizophlyctis rosea]
MDSPPTSTLSLPSSASSTTPPPPSLTQSDTASLSSRRSSHTGASGLPPSYYNKYYTTKRFDLAERQREQRRREEEERGRREEEERRRREKERSFGDGSETVLTDHLEAAVDNLFKLVEKKVNLDHPQRPRTRSRSSSWSSSAIRSEVSKLYHAAERTFQSPSPSSQTTLTSSPQSAVPSYLRMRNPSFDAGQPKNAEKSEYAYPHLPPIHETNSRRVRYLDPEGGDLHDVPVVNGRKLGALRVFSRSSSLPSGTDNSSSSSSLPVAPPNGILKNHTRVGVEERDRKQYGKEDGVVERHVREGAGGDRVGKWMFAFGGCCRDGK